jgi:hypothetical protein
MTATAAETQIAHYLDGVRAALADLPNDVRDELVEDEPAHLAEVLAEGSGTLEERLGRPEAYAAELRAAAGLPPAGGRRSVTTPSAAMIRVRDGVRRADRAIGPVFGYDRAADLLRLLRPGWWVLRGYLAGLVILYVLAGRDAAAFLPLGSSHGWAWFIVVGACVVASVRLGQIMPRLRQWHRWAVGAGGVLVVLLALSGLTWTPATYYEPSVASYGPYDGIQDIYPYDSNNRPLSDVRLFDQDNNPIQLGDIWRCTTKQEFIDHRQYDAWVLEREKRGFTYPLCPPEGWRPGEPMPTPAPNTTPSPTATPSGTPSGTPSETPSGTPSPGPTPSPTR